MLQLKFIKGTSDAERKEIYDTVCKAFPTQTIIFCDQSYDIEEDSLQPKEKGV